MAPFIRICRIFESCNVKGPKGKHSPSVITLSFTEDIYCVKQRQYACWVNRVMNFCFIRHSHFSGSLPS